MENLSRELDLMTDFVKATWIQVVQGGPTAPPGSPDLKFDTVQKRQAYMDSIVTGDAMDIPEAGRLVRNVTATDKLGEETERGKGPWDMKPMLLGGPKARVGKSGHKYNIIPFRHGAPNGSGEDSTFKQMPSDIYAAAKALKASIAAGSGKMKWGERLTGTEGDHPPQRKTLAVPTGQGNALKLVKIQHKSGIFENMVKTQAPHAKATGTQYLTFRVVSEKSPPYSWWHKGMAAQPHLQFVIDYCRPKVEQRLAEAAKLDMIPAGNLSSGMQITVT